MYREAIPALGVSLEQGTESVPDDGRYHLVLDGEVIESYATEKKALDAYRRRRDELKEERNFTTDHKPLDAAEVLRRESLENDLRAIQRDAARSKRSKATRKGGKGGSGGVG